MTEEIELKRKIRKTRKYLSSLEDSLRKMNAKKKKARNVKKRRKVDNIESEFKKRFPNLQPRKSLLALVGTEPPNPPSLDKDLTRQIVAERYDR
jgi:hypothetical protein